MSCVEKRHMSHRMGSMLHHRFPNGFTDLFMDETDREVSALTDRAFRSLCVGDDAVYNDEYLYGYSPFSCHKPVVGDPYKKTHKEGKKQGQDKSDKNCAQPWKDKSISNMSSFLKALSATGKSCEGMLIQNGGMTDSKGESWDKSALRSIQKELSEFSSGYHVSLSERHYGSSNKTNKDAGLPRGKSSKIKNGKSTVKLKKLNIKNFFLHSEFSPFQSWRDFNQFPYGQDGKVLPTDDVPKWYDMPFYKQLTEVHKIETLHTEEEVPACQEAVIKPPPPTAPKPIPPSPPPKLLPKPSALMTETRSSSGGGEGSAAPWRRNRSRAKSAVSVSQSGMPPQEMVSKTADEDVVYVKKEVRSVEVKAVEDVSSLASTPFSICQLMTPVIPSRQPTETSEILQGVFSPSTLDLPLRPHSEAKVTPEPPAKRDGYKALASSILFNLKDNRKRVKSRYSPPKFKTSEVPESRTQSPQSDYLKQGGSEGNSSGLNTPVVLKDMQTVCSPVLESNSVPTVELPKHDTDTPLSGDYLLSNLLQTKREAAGKSPMAKKQNYPSLNLYKKASPVDNDMKYLQAPPPHTNPPTNDLLSKELSPKALSTNTGISPNTLNSSKDCSPIVLPHAVVKEGLSSNVPEEKRPLNASDKAVQKDIKQNDFGSQPVSSKERASSGQQLSTMDVIRAAKEAINAAKMKALSAAQSDSISKPTSDMEDIRDTEIDNVTHSNKMFGSKREDSVPLNSNVSSETEGTPTGKIGNVKKEPPPVPKRNFAISDVQLSIDKQIPFNADKPDDLIESKIDSPLNDESVTRQAKLQHIFSARQNNYIKNQRCSATEDEQGEELEEGDLKVNTGKEVDEEIIPCREMKDSEHIINDLHALKELERAKLGDRFLDNIRNKLVVADLAEQARAKNDLISKELRNIKKGMLSMRGNTLAKRDLFAGKEKDQNKHDAFTKIDNNVIVNRAFFNDNYDKAKMALEEIISDREKKKYNLTEQDINDSKASVKNEPQSKNSIKESLIEASKKQNGSFSVLKENDLKERLGDLRDHNYMRQILSQIEPGLEQNMLLKIKAKELSGIATDSPSYDSKEMNLRHAERQISEESGENVIMNESDHEGKKGDAPAVPPRSKKGGIRKDASVGNETDSVKDEEDDILNKDGLYENGDKYLVEIKSPGLEKQGADSDLFTNQFMPRQSHSEVRNDNERFSVINDANSDIIRNIDSVNNESILPSKGPLSGPELCLSPEIRVNENQADESPSVEATLDNVDERTQKVLKVKRRAPLRPDHLNTLDSNESNNVVAEGKINRASEETNTDGDVLSELQREIVSPVLLVNGMSMCQSPPDHASLSSKSSYFSVESALQRNTEAEFNVYQSLENLIAEVEEVNEESQNIPNNQKLGSDRAEMEYYSFSDHESEPDIVKRLKSPKKETEVLFKDYTARQDSTADQGSAHDEYGQMSPSNSFSPPLEIPALFVVKNNTLTNKPKKTLQPWSPRGSLSGSERGEEELHLIKQVETVTSVSPTIPEEVLESKETTSPFLQSPSSGTPKKPQFGGFLTVPQEEDRLSGISPSSEGVESLTTSTVDTADELGASGGAHIDHGVSKASSERSGSTCSVNESQTGLPKPPAVLPKSEKAVLKAIKLANRRKKKEEAEKSSHKSSQGSSKERSDKNRNHKSEHASNSSRTSKSSERRHREQPEDDCGHSKGHVRKNRNHGDQILPERSNHHERTDTGHKTRRQSHDSVDSHPKSNEEQASFATERPGRSSNRHVRDKPEQRHYSNDRVISNVPVYKAHVSERPPSDRPFHRTQSIDRYLGERVERRLSADMSVTEKVDGRTQRIEKSIMDEFQQRGRGREKANRETLMRRSHSIDAYSNEVPHPSTLSRQSSHSSQLSRQSSMEHAIVAQSFPVTQRKLLQDPDSGQYFFVDMPVQVKTKTFFDPETGSYVQLPVQPPEGAVPQASPLEVLTPPMVVYHSFVPVPLSPMAQKAPIQAPHVAPEELEQRHLERSRQMHCKERHPYLESVYTQHDQMLGEFLGTEELDCPS
ncbi:uncharacterized protein V6R79_009981 [Siganus canaliculatus]